MKYVKLFEQFANEATTSWSKMMKGVKAGETGPWSLVAIQDRKVVGQKINIKIADMLPAHFEAMRKEYPKAKIHIEDATGGVVWNEGFNINEAKELSRDEMMKIMRSKYGLTFVKTTEEFDGEEGGIWLGGSDSLMPNGKDRMFNYYGNSKYPNGVHKDVAKFLDKCGWYGQFADPGTVMLWPKN